MDMKKFLVMILSLVSFVFLLGGCSDDDVPVQAISYSLPGQIRVDVKDELPVIIKTEAEFNTLFSAYEGQLEKIDFDQYDLVYLQGDAYEPEIFETWLDTSTYPYEICVRIKSKLIGRVEIVRWAVAYLLPKSDANQVVFDNKMHSDI